MGALYWFTIEFGSVKEDGIIKPYGFYILKYRAGIAGSVDELKNFYNEKTKFVKLDPNKDSKSDYLI